MEEIELRLAIREKSPDHQCLLKTAQALILPAKLAAEEPVASAPVKKTSRAKAAAPKEQEIVSLLGASFEFTKVRGKFGNESVTNWSELRNAALCAAVKRGLSHDEIRQISELNIHDGVDTASGYKPVDGTNLSVQAKSANDTWRSVRALAEHLQISASLTVFWKQQVNGSVEGMLQAPDFPALQVKEKTSLPCGIL